MSTFDVTWTPPLAHRLSIGRWLLLTVVVALIYMGLGIVGMRYATLPPYNVTAVWPPSGIALAVVVLFGWRALPGVFFGAFFSNFETLFQPAVFPQGIIADICISLGACIQATVSAYLLRRFADGENFYKRTQSVLLFVLFSGLLATSINASIGSSSLVLARLADPEYWARLWITWWVGDIAGVLIFAPLILVWRSRMSVDSRVDLLKLVGLLAGLFIVSVIVCRTQDPVIYLILPIISVISFLYEAHGATIAIVIANSIAIASTAQGLGPFFRDDISESMILLQMFTSTVKLSALLLAAAIHERRSAERALEDSFRTLEDKVELRTSELTSARDTAEAADRAKTLYVAHTAHEFRTPLGAIIGYSEALLDGYMGDLNDETRLAINYVDKNARRLLNLINDTLEVSKIEAGQVDLTITMVNTRALIDEIAQELTSLAQKNNLYLRVEFDAAAPEIVFCDAPRLQQILVNLIGNALKFTNAGGVIVRAEGRPDDTWAVTVTDTGMGIPAESLPVIFDMYQRAHHHDHKRDGTGLGLTIARQLARLMGGDITVNSEVGIGSTFTLTLPQDISA